MKTNGQHIATLLPDHAIARHLRKLTLSVAVYYPEHERRTESELFRQSRHELIDVEHKGCWICGTHEHLESHHFYIEWSLQNAVDWEQFKRDFPQFAHYQSITDFVDSVDNQMILCADHHRHKDKGIHCMDYPEWEIQKVLKAGYQYE